MLTWKCSSIPTRAAEEEQHHHRLEQTDVAAVRPERHGHAQPAIAAPASHNGISWLKSSSWPSSQQLERDAGDAEDQNREQDAAGGVAHRSVMVIEARRQRAAHQRRAVMR